MAARWASCTATSAPTTSSSPTRARSNCSTSGSPRRTTAPCVRRSRRGSSRGKLGYMAPEQARGERVDARADVFACGVILWESVVGRRLWAGKNDAAIMYALHTGEIPPPRDVLPSVPDALDAMCRRALAVQPSDRFESAEALRDAIEAYLGTRPNRPTRRALGERVARLFDSERSQIRAIVEEQLGRVCAMRPPTSSSRRRRRACRFRASPSRARLAWTSPVPARRRRRRRCRCRPP